MTAGTLHEALINRRYQDYAPLPRVTCCSEAALSLFLMFSPLLNARQDTRYSRLHPQIFLHRSSDLEISDAESACD